MRILGRKRDRRLAEREEFRQVRRVVAADVADLGARLSDLRSVPDGAADRHVAEAQTRSAQNPDANGAAHGF